MKTLRLSKFFVDDHEYRCLPMPEIVKHTKQHYYIKIDWANLGYRDLYLDAEYYVDIGSDFESFMQGYVTSARAVLKNIEKTKDHESYERRTQHDWFIETFNITY